jgi:CO/xanthine dehydrogenase Mo-binding subunit
MVEKLTVITDAGTIVDPDGLRTQTDGAAHWGLNMALRDGTEFKKRPHQLKRIGDGGSLAKTIC